MSSNGKGGGGRVGFIKNQFDMTGNQSQPSKYLPRDLNYILNFFLFSVSDKYQQCQIWSPLGFQMADAEGEEDGSWRYGIAFVGVGLLFTIGMGVVSVIISRGVTMTI